MLLFAVAAAASEKDAAFFDKRVAPILTRRCLGCHNNELNDGNISFLDRASLLKGKAAQRRRATRKESFTDRQTLFWFGDLSIAVTICDFEGCGQANACREGKDRAFQYG